MTMSGSIYPCLEINEEFDSTKWNPLHCNVCNEQYRDPLILQCYHSFCAHCLQDRVVESELSCPLCGRVTSIKEGNSLPPPDPLLKFLVESSSGETIVCSNCDKANVEMFYCKTCNQPLCLTCREETHRAKMFSRHDVVLHTKHTRDIQKDCKIHGEPYILFSTEKKIMLCINCFRDMKVESRSHCVDLDTAYKQGCQKIDDTMLSIRDLQSSVRTGILLLRALLEEIQVNADKEKQDIGDLYNEIQEKITDTKESLLQEIDRQFAEKEELFKNQLVSLRTFLPTLHVHLVTCTAFCSSTNKYEFLDFTYEMMKRLTAIIQVQQPLHPSQTSDIVTEYKSKLARCLEPLLFPPRNGMNTPVSIANNVSAATRFEAAPTVTTMASFNSGASSPSDERIMKTRQIQNKKKLKLKLMESNGFFAEHCKTFDASHRELMQYVDGLKQSVQELQRDITLRRSLTKELTISDLKQDIAAAEEKLGCHLSTMEAKQPGLEEHWEESLEMIAAEQEVYQAQIQDIDRLKNEVCSVKTILQKLTSFMSSIANVTQRLAPKLGKASTMAEHDSKHNAILQKINEMQPDSQQRVDAIRTAQEERDIKSANRTNPLDEELIKTKGLLRAPSARRDPAKRLSAEIKDISGESSPKSPDGSPSPKPSAVSENGDKPTTDKSSDKGKDKTVKTSDENGASFVNDIKQLDVATDKVDIDIPDRISINKDVSLKISDDASLRTDESPLSDAIVVLDCETPNEDENIFIDVDIGMLTDSISKSESSSTTAEILGQIGHSLPDVMVQVPMNKVSESSTTMEDNEGTSSSIVSITSESESEMECSMDSSLSEENVRPGHVKDLIAKVVSFSKGSELPAGERLSPSGITCKSPISSDKPTLLDNEDKKSAVTGKVGSSVNTESATQINDMSNTEYDRVNQFVALETSPKSESVNMSVAMETVNMSVAMETSTKPVISQNENGLTVSTDVHLDNGQTNREDDEAYVAKSLPELAQVFEQGEIKTKKRKGRNDRKRAVEKNEQTNP